MEGLHREAEAEIRLETATDYAKEFDRFLEGRTEEVSSDELQGGAKIGEIFTKTFVKAIEAKELDILYGTSEKEIETTIRNCMGMRAGLFVPDASFEVIIRRAIKRLYKPAQNVSDVYEVLIQIVDNLLNLNMKRFSVLAERVRGVNIEYVFSPSFLITPESFAQLYHSLMEYHSKEYQSSIYFF